MMLEATKFKTKEQSRLFKILGGDAAVRQLVGRAKLVLARQLAGIRASVDEERYPSGCCVKRK
jgi:hypothetical protein